MKIGSVGYATSQGLGYLMKSFYDGHVVSDVAIIHHGRRQTHTEWYPEGTLQITNLRHQSQLRFLESWCLDKDVILFFETPFHWELIPYCRKFGIPTVMMPMHECMPVNWPYVTDYILNPSLLDQKVYPQGTYIPVPIDRITWSRRDTAEVFVHNAGHGGLLGRNGTAELITSMQYVKSPIYLIIRTQDPSIGPLHRIDNRIEVRTGTFPRETLYREGDVFVFPEKFNGLSLPLQEAVASGMAVMTTHRFPNTEFLPPYIPINVDHYIRNRVSRRCIEFDEAVIRPKAIAEAIDKVYGTSVSQYSLDGLRWSQTMSWDALRPRYEDYFKCLIQNHKMKLQS